MDLSEFDFELVARSFSAQDLALEQSRKQKLEHDKVYEETLQEFREKTKEFFGVKQEREIFSWKLFEKLNVKSSLSDLQMGPNSKANMNYDEALNLYESMEKAMDEFVNSANTVVVKIRGLGTEFDESIIENRKGECTKKTEDLVNDIETKRENYDLKKNCKKEYEYKTEIFNLKTTVNQLLTNSDYNKLKGEIFENRQQLRLMKNNIEFLTQKNRELRVQFEN